MRKPFYIILAVVTAILMVLILTQQPDATCKRACAASSDRAACVALCVGE